MTSSINIQAKAVIEGRLIEFQLKFIAGRAFLLTIDKGQLQIHEIANANFQLCFTEKDEFQIVGAKEVDFGNLLSTIGVSQPWRTDWESLEKGTLIMVREPFRMNEGKLEYTYDGFITQRLYSSIGIGLRSEKREFKIIQP